MNTQESNAANIKESKVAEYEMNITIMAELVVPEGRADHGLPEQSWQFPIGTMGQIKVEPEMLTGDQPVELRLEKLPKTLDELHSMLKEAMLSLFNMATSIENGELSIEKFKDMIINGTSKKLSVDGDFSEAQLSRLAEMGFQQEYVASGN